MCDEDTDAEFNILMSKVSMFIFTLINLVVFVLNITVCMYYNNKSRAL